MSTVIQNQNLNMVESTPIEDQYFTERGQLSPEASRAQQQLELIHPVFLDERGRPKIIYHGSPSGRGITECGYFDEEFYGKNTGVRDSSEGFTVFASDNAEVSRTYTQSGEYDSLIRQKFGESDLRGLKSRLDKFIKLKSRIDKDISYATEADRAIFNNNINNYKERILFDTEQDQLNMYGYLYDDGSIAYGKEIYEINQDVNDLIEDTGQYDEEIGKKLYTISMSRQDFDYIKNFVNRQPSITSLKNEISSLPEEINELQQKLGYRSSVIPIHILSQNPLIVDGSEFEYGRPDKFSITDSINRARKEGYDALVIENIDDTYDGSHNPATQYAVWDTERIIDAETGRSLAQSERICELPEDQYFIERESLLPKLNLHDEVLDDQGNHITVYHGSRYGEQIKEKGYFDPNKSRLPGYFFTDDREVALSYERSPLPSQQSDIIEANLIIQNPLITDGSSPVSSIRRAKELGHDAVIIKNAHSHGGMTSTHYIVFNPDQIIDPSTQRVMSPYEGPRQYEVNIAPEDQYFTDKYKLHSDVILESGEPRTFYHGSPLSSDIIESGYFDPEKTSENTPRRRTPGFFFADDKDIAGNFMEHPLEVQIKYHNAEARRNSERIEELNQLLDDDNTNDSDYNSIFDQIEFYEQKNRDIHNQIMTLESEYEKTRYKKGIVETNLLIQDPLIVDRGNKIHTSSQISDYVDQALEQNKDSLIVQFTRQGKPGRIYGVFDPSRIINKETQRPMTPYHGPYSYEANPEDQYFADQYDLHSLVKGKVGEPRTFYHGSPTARAILDEGYFDPEKIGSHVGIKTEGFYFITDKESAIQYSDQPEDLIKDYKGAIQGALRDDKELDNNLELGKRIGYRWSQYISPELLSDFRELVENGSNISQKYIDNIKDNIQNRIINLSDKINETEQYIYELEQGATPRHGIVEANLILQNPKVSDDPDELENLVLQSAKEQGYDSFILTGSQRPDDVRVAVVFDPSRIINKATQRPMTPYHGPYSYEANPEDQYFTEAEEESYEYSQRGDTPLSDLPPLQRKTERGFSELDKSARKQIDIILSRKYSNKISRLLPLYRHLGFLHGWEEGQNLPEATGRGSAEELKDLEETQIEDIYMHLEFESSDETVPSLVYNTNYLNGLRSGYYAKNMKAYSGRRPVGVSEESLNRRIDNIERYGNILSKESNLSLPEDQYFTEREDPSKYILDETENILTVYHGSPKGKNIIEQGYFDPNKIGSNITKNEHTGYFFTDNKQLAEVYAQSSILKDDDRDVIQANLLSQNALILDADKEYVPVNESIEYAKQEGYDALIINNARPSGNFYIVFNPSQIINKDTKHRMTPYYGPYRDEVNVPEDQYFTETSSSYDIKTKAPEYVNDEFVDNDGYFKTLYHGSPYGKDIIKEGYFDVDRLGSMTNAESARKGFFFTDSKLVAKGYSDSAPYNIVTAYDDLSSDLTRLQNNPYEDKEKIESVKKELEIIEDEFDKIDESSEIIEVNLVAQDPLVKNASRFGGYELIDSLKEARVNKYDSLILKNIPDFNKYNDPDRISDHYVVFNPEQIINKRSRKVMSQREGPYSYEFGMRTAPEDQYFMPEKEQSNSILSDTEENIAKSKAPNYVNNEFVDEDGYFKTLYHGSPSGRDIIEQGYFDIDKLGETTNADSAKMGFFFTDNKLVAEGYTDSAPYDILELYDDLSNSLDRYQKSPYENMEMIKFIEEELDRIREEFDKIESISKTIEVNLVAQDPLVKNASNFGGYDILDSVKEARDNKHDSLVLKNIPDFNKYNDPDRISDHYVVFNPEQIINKRSRKVMSQREGPYSYEIGMRTAPEDQYLMVNVHGAYERDNETREKLDRYNDLPMFDSNVSYDNRSEEYTQNILTKSPNVRNNQNSLNQKQSKRLLNVMTRNTQPVLSKITLQSGNNRLFLPNNYRNIPIDQEEIFLRNTIINKKDKNDLLIKQGVMAKVLGKSLI